MRKRETISRREILKRVAATAVPLKLGLLSGVGSVELLAGQVGVPRNLRFIGTELMPGSPLAQGVHPRTYLTPATLSELRNRIATNSAFRARWQTAVTEFESSGGYWASGSTNPFTIAFAAVLACVRRPTDDLGISWATPGAAGWQAYRDRVVSTVSAYTQGGNYAPVAWATGMVYDLLYQDLTSSERSQFSTWVTVYADQYREPGEHWADQDADDYVARALCSLAADDGATRWSAVVGGMQDWAESRAWMAFANGVGYEGKEEQPTQIGPVLGLFICKNAGSLSESETTDLYLPVLADAWQLNRQFSIPHPSLQTSVEHWYSDRVNMTGPTEYFHRQLRLGPTMMWGLALLPGKVDPSVLQYLQHELEYAPPTKSTARLKNVTNCKYITFASSTSDQPNAMGFYAFVPWLLLNAKEVTASTAGIPLARRWWPGTLEWTTVRSSMSHSNASLITYHHRKYHLSSYEHGTRQNGSWHVHRGGPLLIQRGDATHSPTGRFWTHLANGTVSFVDTSLPEGSPFGDVQKFDNGGVRPGPDADNRLDALKNLPASDFGDVTAWHNDGKAVAISSDLTRSYNSSLYAHAGGGAGNEPKLSHFSREFVVIQRGGDGTDHERVFTYDRLNVLGEGKFEPRYNLCPGPPQIDIDGSETAYSSLLSGATGPTRWDYSGATRLIVDNTVEPTASIRGDGKVCVTWLRPNGSGVRVRKRGGTALTAHPTVAPESPFFTQQGSPISPNASEWRGIKGTDKRAYCGLYTVEVIPVSFSASTRFLMVADVMSAGDSPSATSELSCDVQSVAARCGASAVVFAREAVKRNNGNVTIPSGVTLVVLVNLTPNRQFTLSGSGGLGVSSSSVRSSADGVITISVTSNGVLTFA